MPERERASTSSSSCLAPALPAGQRGRPRASSRSARTSRSSQAFAAPPVADNQGILVTIFLSGGNDGLNMVVPVGDPRYAALRPTLQDHERPLRSAAGSRCTRRSPKLKARFDQGKVAVVRGVGYQPPDLSHFTSTDIWMHGWGGGGTPTTGWLGRFLDRLPNTDARVALRRRRCTAA